MKQLVFRLAIALFTFSLGTVAVDVTNQRQLPTAERIPTAERTVALNQGVAPRGVPPVNVTVTRIGELPAPINEDSSVGLQFVSEKDGWLSIDNQDWRTRDGGRKWELVAKKASDQEDPQLPVGFFRFVNAETGWWAKDRKLLRTDNGGRTWHELPTPLSGRPVNDETKNEGIEDFSFAPDGIHGWLVIEEFRPLTANEVWGDPHSTYSEDKKRVLRSKIYYTSNGGRTWKLQPMEYSWNGVYSVKAIDTTHAIAYGMGGVFSLRDGTWISSKEEIGPDRWVRCLEHGFGFPTLAPMDVTFANTKVGWITNSNGYLGKTVDGGKTWFDLSTELRSQETEMPLGWGMVVAIIDPMSGWALDVDGKLRVTEDGGVSWLFVNDDRRFLAMFWLGHKAGWVVSKEGIFSVARQPL